MNGNKAGGKTRLGTGQEARKFNVDDVEGKPVALEQYSGRWLLLSFYRYASCPLCNLRVHELIKQHQTLQADGLNLVAFFQSSAANIKKYVGRQQVPFPIVADPKQSVYRLYGVEPSWAGLGRVMTRLPVAVEAVFGKRFWPGSIDGNLAMVPADFLIGPDQIIRHAYYGRDISDHMPINDIRNYLRA